MRRMMKKKQATLRQSSRTHLLALLVGTLLPSLREGEMKTVSLRYEEQQRVSFTRLVAQAQVHTFGFFPAGEKR